MFQKLLIYKNFINFAVMKSINDPLSPVRMYLLIPLFGFIYLCYFAIKYNYWFKPVMKSVIIFIILQVVSIFLIMLLLKLLFC